MTESEFNALALQHKATPELLEKALAFSNDAALASAYIAGYEQAAADFKPDLFPEPYTGFRREAA